jgi:two-component system LytT family response regulator
MSDWTVLIADDEPLARRGVRQMLASHPDFHVIRECRNGTEVLAALDDTAPHVIFLDVQMPDVDGFEVIRRRTPERMPATVFLTAYDQFAIRAFDAEAHDYLVKPVTEARFAATMQRLRRRLRGDVGRTREPAVVVTDGGRSTVLPLREIDWIEAANNYARIWVGRRSYLLRDALADLERRVAPHGFARAHRRALVRVDGVRELSTSGEGNLIATLSSGTRVPVSRRRRTDFTAAVRAAGA